MRANGLRQKLVTKLQRKGILDTRVLHAISIAPRHLFMPQASLDFAYRDVAYDIGVDQTISRPHTVAVQSSLLDVRPGDKILEIGTGSGYQAAILSLLGAKVYTVERQASLYTRTNTLLQDIGFGSIRTILGDGYEGLERFAPFDKIVVTCGADHIPDALLQQLQIGGVLVIPHGDGAIKRMLKIVKTSDTTTETSQHGDFSFVPFLKGTSQRISDKRRTRKSSFDPSLKRVALD